MKEFKKDPLMKVWEEEDNTSLESIGGKKIKDDPHVDKVLVVGVVTALVALAAAAYLTTK